MKEKELKPCPFCGSTDIGLIEEVTVGDRIMKDIIHCYTCGAAILTCCGSGELISRWNKGPKMSEQEKKIKVICDYYDLLEEK